MTTGAETTRTLYGELGHLSDDQMNDALVGDLAAEAAGHLAACSVCQEQLAAVRMPLESFKAVTLAWSERRSATLPVSLNERALQHASNLRRRGWVSAVAALLAVMVAVPYGIRRESSPSESSVVPMESSQVRAVRVTGVAAGNMQPNETNPEQIARDNQMLSEIDRELESNTASSAVMELQDVQGQASRSAAGQAIQD